MAKRTKRSTQGKRQLAALATLLGLMQTAAKLSGELDELAVDIGGSLEDIVKASRVPFFDVHAAYVRRIKKKKVMKKKAMKRKRSND